MAPVPCMSSLKIRYFFALSTRIRRAFDGPKSSKCSSALGKSSEAVLR
jgi:hypothetical protein